MAAARQVIEISIGEDDLTRLEGIARSRTEPACRVERARILLAYRTDPSTHAVGEAIGVTHQTVQRCLRSRRAARCDGGARRQPASGQGAGDHRGGPRMAGLAGLPEGQGPGISARAVDDAAAGAPRPRARRRPPDIHVWRTSLKARSARSSTATRSSRTRCATTWNAATRRSRRRWPKCSASIARSRCCARAMPPKAPMSRSSPTTRSRASRRSATPHPTCRRKPGVYESFARDHEYKRHGTLSLLAGHRPADRQGPCLCRGSPSLARVRRLPQAARCRVSVRHGHQADPRQSFRSYLQGDESVDSDAARGSLCLRVHTETRLLAQSRRGFLLQDGTLDAPPHPRCLEGRTQGKDHAPSSMISTATPSSIPGPTKSIRPRDRSWSMETLYQLLFQRRCMRRVCHYAGGQKEALRATERTCFAGCSPSGSGQPYASAIMLGSAAPVNSASAGGVRSFTNRKATARALGLHPITRRRHRGGRRCVLARKKGQNSFYWYQGRSLTGLLFD